MTKGTVRSLIRWFPLICCGVMVGAFTALTWYATGMDVPWASGPQGSALEVIKKLRIVEILSWSW